MSLTRAEIAALERDRELVSSMPTNRGHRFVKQLHRGGMELGHETHYACACGATFVVVQQQMRPTMYTPVVCDCSLAQAEGGSPDPLEEMENAEDNLGIDIWSSQ